MTKTRKASNSHRSLDYRRKALPRSITLRLLRRGQARLYERYASIFPPEAGQRVLDLGVNGSLEQRRDHFFEDRYPFPRQIVAAGLEEPDLFTSLFPEIEYVQLRRSEPLPFEDGSFDVVFSNAVVEHVGSRETQAAFLGEVFRVGRSAFVTTPNRWFPIEVHTVLPLVHYLPTSWYRRIFRLLGFQFFADASNLNLLDRSTLRSLIPEGVTATIHGLRTLGFVSNLLLAGGRSDAEQRREGYG